MMATNLRKGALDEADLGLILANNPIAVLYDDFNGIDTATYYFSKEEAIAAEEKFRHSDQYSVVYLAEDKDVSM